MRRDVLYNNTCSDATCAGENFCRSELRYCNIYTICAYNILCTLLYVCTAHIIGTRNKGNTCVGTIMSGGRRERKRLRRNLLTRVTSPALYVRSIKITIIIIITGSLSAAYYSMVVSSRVTYITLYLIKAVQRCCFTNPSSFAWIVQYRSDTTVLHR
jgi:hypothetical protein